MIRQATLDKLHKMRLSGMAASLVAQCQHEASYETLPFEDRMAMIVDDEWQQRQNNKLEKLIRTANFRYPDACMEDIEYYADRQLDKSQLTELATCRYIQNNHHIILKGSSGSGKTYIACALGNAACRNYFNVKYCRVPDLLNEFALAHGEGTFRKLKKYYQKIHLLILDEFLLAPVSSDQARELLEIIETRSVKGSVIFCTQFEPKGWYTRIGTTEDETMAEAIIDRIVPNSYELFIDSKISMRERHGIRAESTKDSPS